MHPWQNIKVREPIFLALYPPRIDQYMKVSVTSKAFLDLDQPGRTQRRKLGPDVYCCRLFHLTVILFLEEATGRGVLELL